MLMRWADVSFTDKTIRQFAAFSLVIFLGLAVWHGRALDNRLAALFFAAMALLIGPVGLCRPRWIRPIYVAWMAVSFPLGWVVSHVLLLLLYFLLFTPIALLFRFISRDSLRRQFRPELPTYWEARQTRAISDYWRQY
jgi:hypothetical protein